VGIAQNGAFQINEIRQRIFIDQAQLVGSYPFNTTRRLELTSGFIRYGFNYEVVTFTDTGLGLQRDRFNANNCGELSAAERQAGTLCEPDPIYFFQGGAAYVGDYSNFGFTSPVQGGRYRFEVSPNLGTESFLTLLADYRRYFFANPFTFAVRGLHIGNYGASADDNTRFGQEYLGYSYYPGFIRGYSFGSFEPQECGPDQITENGSCAAFDRLFGTRLAMTSAEVRLPFLGTDDLGLINFPYLPTELTVFSDVGLAWNAGDNPFDLLKFEENTTERVPVASVGTSARFNLLGYLIFEIYYAYPFQRPEKGAHFGFSLIPGW
jgi:hypothetical protein